MEINLNEATKSSWDFVLSFSMTSVPVGPYYPISDVTTSMSHLKALYWYIKVIELLHSVNDSPYIDIYKVYMY